MSTKMTYDQIKAELALFTAASKEKYGSYAHAAGYLESVIASLVMDLPKHKQLGLAQCFRVSTAELQKEEI